MPFSRIPKAKLLSRRKLHEEIVVEMKKSGKKYSIQQVLNQISSL